VPGGHDPEGSHYTYEIATPEPALSGGEILRLQIRMTRSEGARNDNPDVIARHPGAEAISVGYRGLPRFPRNRDCHAACHALGSQSRERVCTQGFRCGGDHSVEIRVFA